MSCRIHLTFGVLERLVQGLISVQAIVSICREGAGVTLSRLDLNRPKLAAALEKLVADKGYRDAMRCL